MDTQETSTDEVDSHLQQDTLLRFRVGPFRFSVPAVEVEGIIIPPALTRIPLNPPHSKGVFIYHRRLSSAISLRSKFGLPDNDDNNLGQLILGEVSVGLVAFWVDEVYETVSSSELEWRAMPDFVPHAAFDSFATKGDEVVLASTMQQLYDVPAEDAASMLASVRESFDLPEDVAPVASELVNAGEADESDEDAFGDLLEIESSHSGDVSNETEADSGLAASETREPGIGLSGESVRGSEHPSATQKGLSSQDLRTAGKPVEKTGVGATSGRVVDLSARRTGHAVNTEQATRRPAPGQTIPDQTTSGTTRHEINSRSHAFTNQHTATRTASGQASSANVRAEAVRRSSSADSSSRYGGRSSQQTFVGGTHAGAYDRLHQSRPPAGSSQYHQQPHYSQSSPVEPNEEISREEISREEKSRTALWWWLLAILLLFLLLAFWFWPDSKKDMRSVSVNQGTVLNDSYRQPAPTVQEPVSSYEAVSPPAIPSEPPATETVEPSPNVESAPVIEAKNPDEVYRLEGKEVTVTVERKQAAPAEEPVEPAAIVKTKPVPGYNEFVHVVVKGDTLWDIAAKYLKNPFRYPELAELSKINNPDLIYPGDTVRIRVKKK